MCATDILSGGYERECVLNVHQTEMQKLTCAILFMPDTDLFSKTGSPLSQIFLLPDTNKYLHRSLFLEFFSVGLKQHKMVL